MNNYVIQIIQVAIQIAESMMWKGENDGYCVSPN